MCVLSPPLYSARGAFVLLWWRMSFLSSNPKVDSVVLLPAGEIFPLCVMFENCGRSQMFPQHTFVVVAFTAPICSESVGSG